jgi:hypothetical protein
MIESSSQQVSSGSESGPLRSDVQSPVAERVTRPKAEPIEPR